MPEFGGNVYEHHANDHLPHCMYIYYFNSEFEYLPRVYFYDFAGPITDVRDRLRHVVEGIRSDALYPCGWSFSDIHWRRVSYLVFVIDGPGAEFPPRNSIRIDRVGNENRNFSFFDGDDGIIDADGGPFAAAWCINRLLNSTGGKEDGRHSVEFKVRYKGLRLEARGKDDDRDGGYNVDGGTGTNMGPPVPPPDGRRIRPREGDL